MAQRSMTLSRKSNSLASRTESQAAGTPGPADFETVFHQQWSRLCAALYRFTGDWGEAEDLALEAFVQLWQRPPVQAENLGGWLYRVATRLGLNQLRGAARRDRYEQAALSEPFAPSTPASPDGEVEQRQERARVRAVLAEMDERQARLLLMRHAGFSYQEIAAALGLNPASVGALLNRAEQAFEKRYTVGPDEPKTGRTPN